MSQVRLVALTPPGPAGVALLAVRGPGAAALLARCFQPRGAWPAPGHLAVGRLRDAQGEPLDEAVLACADAETWELGCHGGPAQLRRVRQALEAAGAAPGPHTEAGDPLAAAALEALPGARTALGAQALLRQANGQLRAAWGALAELLTRDPSAAAVGLRALRAQAHLGRHLLEPTRVALVGLPSAGKSSLLNALLGRQRTLVSPEPGTTRDLVEVEAELGGLPLVLVDAAGWRESDDPLEAEGVRRARLSAAAAGLRLVVIDGAAPTPAAWALARAQSGPALVVLTKLDLLTAPPGWPAQPWPVVAVSSTTGAGLPALEQALVATLAPGADLAGPLPCAPAQWDALDRCEELLRAGDARAARRALEAAPR